MTPCSKGLHNKKAKILPCVNINSIENLLIQMKQKYYLRNYFLSSLCKADLSNTDKLRMKNEKFDSNDIEAFSKLVSDPINPAHRMSEQMSQLNISKVQFILMNINKKTK